MRRISAMIALVVLAACGDQQPAATPRSTVGTSPAALASCTNDQAGYTLRYPGDWHTNSGEVMAACSVFDTDPFELPEASEIPAELAVRVTVDRVDFDVAARTEGDFERELSRSETTVAGHRAVRLEVEATGDALLPGGTRSYRYVVDLVGRTLIASTNDTGGTDYEQKQAVLDEMMSSLQVVPN